VLPALHGGGVDLFKWTLASALILPASVLLGTTFPLMSGGIMRLFPESSGRALSMLYFTNSFGAALGVLLSGFYLIDHLGLPGTILTAGLLNITLAVVVWLIARRMPAPPVVYSDERTGARARAFDARTLTRAVLLLAFATGAASFIYEITWIRMLTLGLGASTHAFEVMLAAFILAMSLGAFWFRNRIATVKNDIAWLAGLLIAKALLAVYAIWIYGDVLTFIGWMMGAVARSDGGYVLNTLAGLAASMLVMFPTAFCAGMTLPLATHALTSRGLGEASIGRVYGANTAGCIVGAAFATHVGMSAFGVKGLTGVGALLDISVAMMLLVVVMGIARKPKLAAALSVVAVLGLAGFLSSDLDLLRMSSGVYRHGFFQTPADSSVHFYRDGKTATIAVIDTGHIRSIRTNGKPDASLSLDDSRPAQPDEATMILAAALPLAIRPDAQMVANIGFGSGLTTHSLLGSPNIKRLDSIEIERMMIEGARLFGARNERAYNDPRSRIHIEDAKTFFASNGERYDIIVSEPSNPWVSGVSTLFSEEFYSHVKRYMKDDGLLVQWIQTYEIDLGLLSTVLNALSNNFADYNVYGTTADLLVIATPKGTLAPLRGDVFGFPGVASDLNRLGFTNLRDLEALRVGGRRALEPLFRSTGFPPNSDYFPILDQRAPKARFRNSNTLDVIRMREGLVPTLALIDGDWRTPLERIRTSGLNRPGRINSTIAGGEAMGVALTGAAERSRLLQPQDRASAVLAHALLDNCRGAQGEWLQAVAAVSTIAVPSIERDDVQPFFDRMRGSACARSLDERSRHRLGLLEAINARDARAMLAHAGALLEDPLESERPYYLMSALSAALATGEIARAVELRDRHLERVPPRERDAIQWRLLLAHLALAQRKPQ
jgi:spermidine synthase